MYEPWKESAPATNAKVLIRVTDSKGEKKNGKIGDEGSLRHAPPTALYSFINKYVRRAFMIFRFFYKKTKKFIIIFIFWCDVTKPGLKPPFTCLYFIYRVYQYKKRNTMTKGGKKSNVLLCACILNVFVFFFFFHTDEHNFTLNNFNKCEMQ